MTKHMFKLVVCISVIVVAFAFYVRFGILNKAANKTIITSSILTDAIDIAELSTAEFKYRGIAEIYSDEKKTKVKCRVCYNAIVKAGIDMNLVQFETDTTNKKITVTLPDIELKVTIIDEQSMALLPSDAKVGIESMLRYSREDAEREALESTELMKTARENLQTTIEAMLYPVLRANDYVLQWK